VILGVIMQLGVAGVLLTGVATFTGIINWSNVVRSVLPREGPATVSGPGPTGQSAGDEGKPLLDRAFKALPPPPPPGSSDRPPACNVADSARLSRLGREHQDWDDQARMLIACRQVRRGFTVDQIRAALGKPARVVRHDSGGEEWIYNDKMRVVVKDGQVTAVTR
jgi:hypothetical protein